MLKQTIIIGLAAGLLIFLFQIGSQWFLFSMNYWELILLLMALFFAGAGALYMRFSQTKDSAKKTTETPSKLPDDLDLSPRETEVLQELIQGKSNQQIAESLYISESTVKTHVSKLLLKFDVRSRTQIMRKMQGLQAPTLVGNNENHTKV